MAALLAASLLALIARPAFAEGAAPLRPGKVGALGSTRDGEKELVSAYRALLSPRADIAAIGALGEPLTLDEAIRAGLLASGIETGRLSAYEARLCAFLDGLAESAEIATPALADTALADTALADTALAEATRAEAVLAYLHAHILRRYELNATTLDLILDEGRFNCVSSAYLYLLALKRIGIKAYGVRTEDHAFCLVRAGERDIDVETTSAYGFDPGTKKEFADTFGRTTGYSYVPPGHYAQRRTIGEKELAALIISNRAADLERRGAYREALALGSAYAALAPSAEGKAFLVSRIGNLLAEQQRRREARDSEALLAAAFEQIGDEPRLLELHAMVAYNAAVALAEAGHWEEVLARALKLRGGPLDAKAAALGDAALQNLVGWRIAAGDYAEARALVQRGAPAGSPGAIGRLRAEITEAELDNAARRLPFREALARAERLAEEGELERRRLDEFVIYLYGSEAQKTARRGDWLGAAELAAEGAARLPSAASLAQAAGVYRQNFAAEAHNRFAALYNRGDYAAALRAASDAAATLADRAGGLRDKTLEADIALAQKALGH